ncbi:MAG: right-handed parallel beta-helix repeat-containing protein [Deltaproteobacteria bacterium]|nr:right-handed parallel beta-helix repeat-containing protein [Deltaproteobacteria bacterium]
MTDTTPTPMAASPKASACDVQVPSGGAGLAEAVAKATTGARLCLAAGEHRGGLLLDKSVTLVGDSGAVVVGSGRGPVLRVDDDGLAVRLEGLTLRGGVSDAGGGFAIFGRGKVTIDNCTFSRNKAGMAGGGGLYARGGLLVVENTTFDGNEGRQGGAVFLDQALKAEFKRCTFAHNRGEVGGALRASEGVEVALKACTLADNTGGDGAAVKVSGTKSRKATVAFDHCQVADGALVNGPEIPGNVSARGCTLPASWKTAGLDDRGGNSFK